jgi:hypothetical protein
MSELPPEPPHEPSEFHHSRRQHAGELDRYNEEQLDELTEEERVDLGVDPFDPDEVPPVTDSPVYQDARAEIDKEEAEGELRLNKDGFPPTRYDES